MKTKPTTKDFKAMNEATWCALNNEITIQMHSEEGAISNLTEAEMTSEPGVDATLEYSHEHEHKKGD